MEQPWLPANFNRALLNLLSSPEIKLVGEQLHISNHLDMIRDSLWGINAFIVHSTARANELRKWLKDVEATITSLDNILKDLQEAQKQEVTPPHPPILLRLGRISSTSTLSLRSRRRAILVELNKIALSLNCLLSRAHAFRLKIDTMDSMDPDQVEYYSILQKMMPERENDVKRVVQIIFQLRQGNPLWDLNEDVPFVTVITGNIWTEKSRLARMVYHHPLVREFFKYRIWVDVFSCASFSFDHMHIARECARHLNGRISSNTDIWSLIRRSVPQTRYLLVLDRINEITMEDKDKWVELKKNLLSSSAPGTRVIITCHFYNIPEEEKMVYSDKVYKLDDKSYDDDKSWDDDTSTDERQNYSWDS